MKRQGMSEWEMTKAFLKVIGPIFGWFFTVQTFIFVFLLLVADVRSLVLNMILNILFLESCLIGICLWFYLLVHLFGWFITFCEWIFQK